MALSAIGILRGLIYTEHYLRWRDRTAERRPTETIAEQRR